MQKYGIIESGELKFVPKGTPGAKPVKWEELPEFDQTTQAVYEKTPIDKGNHIWIELEVREIEQDGEEKETEEPEMH